MPRILFVDDEPLVLRGLHRSLSAYADEWQMEFVTSGREALRVLEAGLFDVVVTDVRMPGMNGAELLTELTRRHPGIARIVLSGQADQELVFECLAVAHQYLLKPCEPEVLIAAVSRVLGVQAGACSTSLLALVGRLQRLPSSPDLCQTIDEMLRSTRIDIERLGAVVETDVALTAKLLKLANSAFFGLSRCVISAGEAVRCVGVEVLKALVAQSQPFEQYRDLESAGVDAEELWQRSIRTAAAARAIARVEGQPVSIQEQAFTAGMLHTCGLLVLANDAPETFRGLLRRAREQCQSLHCLERETYGVTDAQVAECLLGLWGVPMSIVDAVAHYRLEAPRPFGVVTFVHAAHALLGEMLSPCESWPAAPLNRDALAAAGVADREALWRRTVAATAGCD